MLTLNSYTDLNPNNPQMDENPIMDSSSDIRNYADISHPADVTRQELASDLDFDNDSLFAFSPERDVQEQNKEVATDEDQVR